MKTRNALSSIALSFLLVACGGGGGGGGSPGPFFPPLSPAGDLFSTTEGSAALLDVLANDGGDPSATTVSIVSEPHRGKVTVEADGQVRYEPYPGFNGTDSFTYSATAGTTSGTAVASVTVYSVTSTGAPVVLLPRLGIRPDELGVIVNDDDPQSVAAGAYYVKQRRIPDANVVHLSIPSPGAILTPTEFAPLKAAVDAALGPDVQALAICWNRPYRVSGMSITSAFALGFDEKYENTSGTACAPTAAVPYYDSDSTQPFTDFGIRPAMLLLGDTEADVESLVDRGIASDGTFPPGTAYLIRTGDAARSVRWPAMQAAAQEYDHLPDGIDVRTIDASTDSSSSTIQNTDNVLLYETGLATVPGIETNTYRPGAIADHLTSYAGNLDQTFQMTVDAWLNAGVTGSYGTVVEPCNYVEKFPNPLPLLDHYYRGNTLIEAYWKSVDWPGQGLFVGEPLASPFGRYDLEFDSGTLSIRTTSLKPGQSYRVVAADSPAGPFTVVKDGITIPYHRMETIVIPSATRKVYRLEPTP